MAAWDTLRRFGATIALLCVFVFPSLAAEPTTKPVRSVKPTPTQLREIAEKAEKAGDWEAAFTAYCHLFVSERNSPELREKLNSTLRRVQQVRRHRDAGFQQFASGMTLSGSLDLFAEVMQKVPVVYADRERATPQNLWAFAIEELDRALGTPAFRQAFLDNPRANDLDQFRSALRREWAKRIITDYKEARTALRQLVALAQDKFTVRVPAALVLECSCGACSGLDEYTVFLTPNATTPTVVPDLSAAGLYLGWGKDGLVIEGIIPNSWAALNHPQLQRGTRITRINGRTMDNAGLAGAAEALRHPNNGGFHQIEFPPGNDGPPLVARIPVNVPTVYGTKLLNPKEIGYIRIGSFSPTTPRELDEAIATLKTDGVRVIVLDLRGNHGGSFLAGVEVARRLLPAGLIVTTQGQAPEVDNQVFSSSSGMTAHDIPLVLLIDAETASAAEVVAAALKDHDRATLVGMPSFGKGSVQYPLRLVTLDDVDRNGKKIPKTGTVRITIARLIAPRGGPINGVGVNPHFLEADFDTQLELAIEKAIELIPSSMMRPMPSPLQVSP